MKLNRSIPLLCGLVLLSLGGCAPKRVAPPEEVPPVEAPAPPAPVPEEPVAPEEVPPAPEKPVAPEEVPPAPEKPVAPPEEAPAAPAPIPLRITAIGDVNFNRNRVEVRADGIDLWGNVVSFAPLAEKLKGLVDGDLNFANIETVVTDRNDFDPPDPEKQFCFRSHPNGVKVLLDAGFNLFCLANNHAFDYGATGIVETLKNMQAFAEERTMFYAGIGRDYDEAAAPTIFTVKGVRVGFTAIGIGGRAGPGVAGVAHVSTHRKALEKLRDADVDLRILSVHDGKEGILFPIDRQILVSREAIRDFDVDLVIGHHPHRVQGIERYADGLIYYSLGNGLMRGAADIKGKRVGGKYADFGLMTRLNLEIDPGTKAVTFKRLEAVPLYDMHQQPGPLSAEEAAMRIQTLNEISAYPYMEQDWNKTCPPSSRKEPVVFKADGILGYVDLGPSE